nr:NAD(P)H-hydrate epimerase [Oxalobacteraceae bacterium]
MATGSADLRIYSVARVRDIERAALSSLPAGTLMSRAGAAAAHVALGMLEQRTAPVLVLAGPGNNGGDALEAAALLAQRGVPVMAVLMADPQRLPTDALAAYQRARGAKVQFVDRFDVTAHWALAIDGLFGIGLARPLAGPFAAAVEQINALNCPVLAIDVPSGLDADNGGVLGGALAVRADTTLTLIADKPGLHTGCGRDYAGKVVVDALGLDVETFGAPLARLITPALFPDVFIARAHASHKGSFGDVTVIGGAPGMSGAVLLAARMSAMAGAGRVFAAFAAAPPAFDPVHPELMCRDATAIELHQGSVVIGPGLG